jgi:hypothetical protein
VNAEPPPMPGQWVKRESLPRGLDHAKSLLDIAYFNPNKGDCHGWNVGLTSQDVQYWVRIHEETK